MRIRDAALAAAVVILGPSALAAPSAERTAVCLSCHGETGRSETPNVPSLGGQPSAFTLNQLYLFREKLRLAEPMNTIAAELSDDDLQDFSDFLAALPPPAPQPDGDTVRLAAGRAAADKHRCGFCHNADLSGHDHIPRLAGQREDYLVGALQAYKSGSRTGYDPAMVEIAKAMSDAEILDAAYFVAHFR